MKRFFFVSILLLAASTIYCQVTEAEKTLKTKSAVDTTLGWKKGGVININSAQTSLTNWAAGGQSSVAISGLVNTFAHKKTEKSLWENYLILAYGTMKQKETGWWKTDDRIDLTSKYGRTITDKLYYASLLNFKTQITPGYNYPNDSVKISDFLAPGYLLIAIGLDYVPMPELTLFFAPITYKLTIVNDDVLSNAGMFGVEPGEHTKSEFGGYIRASLQKDIMQNVTLQTKLDLFTNYLKNFGVVDVNWETMLSMKVNKLITATISTQLLYDQDVTIKKEVDPGVFEEYNSKVQFKEVLAIGLALKF
jgi:hypothetical protein